VSALSRPYAERDGSEIQHYETFSVEYRDASHRYWIHVDGERNPAVSVTAVLGVLDKPALLGWAEACGAEGALILERRGELRNVDPKAAIDIVRINGLGKDAKRDAGADRGTAIHDALRIYASEGTAPNVGDFPAEVRGYVSGLCKWLLEANPEPVHAEQIVGSAKHGYAGRLDLIANLAIGRTLVDLKTSPRARLYPEAHIQAAGYALAAEECGIEPPAHILIVGVGEEGNFTTQMGCADPRDFRAVLACHKAVARVRAGAKLAAAA